MPKKISLAKFHQGIHIPSVGTLGDTLPSPGKTLTGLSMSLEDNGYLLIKCGGIDPKTKKPVQVSALVPSTNIVVMTVEEEEQKS